jgi:hypothetical protein
MRGVLSNLFTIPGHAAGRTKWWLPRGFNQSSESIGTDGDGLRRVRRHIIIMGGSKRREQVVKTHVRMRAMGRECPGLKTTIAVQRSPNALGNSFAGRAIRSMSLEKSQPRCE